ncbi:MAG: cyclopropane fatty acyl phospholipid synthase [Deltaproteobacteria bacterium]|nr:cyclopropane fatty acyl phospholipid synthase [Deltaproteobacteria bacterium]MBT4265829.1 cyclopropane fatty acyl phospholipid synthase [Deltaproteobacteria bacterium]MBT4637608.1 cyclopropane fatty acyl phospholipid synthase [Deltaproteobacteria bacterium]MBT6503142.1 cyclopropane fatty acyl phospholipid synthase [Deltaproteobacteria bacterium]MBT6611216.1 cyclopropane fatty acyl phospholipid synthase [Deltaproteobacteria bacterium]
MEDTEMENSKTKRYLSKLFKKSGVTINGNKPWDIQVRNDNTYKRLIYEGTLGAGESYMDEWWECKALDQFIAKILSNNIEKYVKGNWKLFYHAIKSRVFNLQNIRRAFTIGREHYDIGNDLYTAMLGKKMLYSCGYWKDTNNLDDAQEAKLDLICRKINLEPGMSLLEFGCGFGYFAKFAAEKYGVKVTGLTVSEEQLKLGRELCRGLPVELKLDDYRNISGTYDRVISIGMLEHVGYKNYRTYMECVDQNLKDDGIAFIQTIGANKSTTTVNEWTSKFIFPNSMIPSISQIGQAMEELFVMEDWHNLGEHYDKTLMAWFENFESAWPKLKKQYDNRFYRMWKYYLLSCAGAFRSRNLQAWQIVMRKPSNKQPYYRVT